MPWKGEKDPYKIWLSEIILQQTRVEQGRRYYENFIAAFPNVQALALAPEEKVFKLWEGLGYYTRCRNLLIASKQIHEELQNQFPSDHPSLCKLKGIGSYTAAAIASFAYNLPHAVVDGNVYRVLSRIFALAIPIDSAAGKKLFATLAHELLDKKRAAEYNQAVMDFGATICKPQPACEQCFFKPHCQAYQKNDPQLFPLKKKKPVLKKRWLHYILITSGNKVLIRQRQAHDIWRQLHEFFLIESSMAMNTEELAQSIKNLLRLKTPVTLESVEKKMQKLSHQEIHFMLAKLSLSRSFAIKGYTWMSQSDVRQLAFPKSLKTYLEQHL